MIASLRGEVISKALDHAVIECAGVGYIFNATPATLATLIQGEETLVLITMVVKEDSMTLYGFTSDDDRKMFGTLQSVSGLGAKLAMAALSVLSAPALASAISSDDTKTLQSIPGVGKKMAERMALELKDKVGQFGTTLAGARAEVSSATNMNVEADNVVEALVGLGFREKMARPVVESLLENGQKLDTTALLRASLAILGKS